MHRTKNYSNFKNKTYIKWISWLDIPLVWHTGRDLGYGAEVCREALYEDPVQALLSRTPPFALVKYIENCEKNDYKLCMNNGNFLV